MKPQHWEKTVGKQVSYPGMLEPRYPSMTPDSHCCGNTHLGVPPTLSYTCHKFAPNDLASDLLDSNYDSRPFSVRIIQPVLIQEGIKNFLILGISFCNLVLTMVQMCTPCVCLAENTFHLGNFISYA